MVIGFIASAVCFIGVAIIKPKFGYDDSLDAFGVHGIGGILGTIAVGIFATKAVNPAGADGLLAGNPRQLLIQCFGVLAAALYTFVVTWVIYKFVDIFLRVRVKEREEVMGLDLTQHREQAYTIME